MKVDLHNGLKTVVVLFIMKLLMTDHPEVEVCFIPFVYWLCSATFHPYPTL